MIQTMNVHVRYLLAISYQFRRTLNLEQLNRVFGRFRVNNGI
jgi:hypothetical protein